MVTALHLLAAFLAVVATGCTLAAHRVLAPYAVDTFTDLAQTVAKLHEITRALAAEETARDG